MSVLSPTADFTGSNTEKIDKLVTVVIELRAMLKLCYYIIGAGFPLLILLLSFLVAKAYEASAKLDRLGDHIVYLQRDHSELKSWVEKLENKAGKP